MEYIYKGHRIIKHSNTAYFRYTIASMFFNDITGACPVFRSIAAAKKFIRNAKEYKVVSQ